MDYYRVVTSCPAQRRWAGEAFVEVAPGREGVRRLVVVRRLSALGFGKGNQGSGVRKGGCEAGVAAGKGM